MRLIAHRSRSIHLEWIAGDESFDFRLLYGETFLTPRLHLGPLQWYDLIEKCGTTLSEKPRKNPDKHPDWVRLRRTGNSLEIFPVKGQIDYGRWPDGNPELGVPETWPKLLWSTFYDKATKDRGDKPEAGWEKVYNAHLDAVRESWG